MHRNFLSADDLRDLFDGALNSSLKNMTCQKETDDIAFMFVLTRRVGYAKRKKKKKS